MPTKRGHSNAQNLGTFTLKNPDPDSLNNLDLDSETDGEIEIQEENDVPHPQDHADLLQWLQLRQELRKLDKEESVPLASMRQFAVRSSRFADAYFHGLDGADAAWANKKYRGHRALPPRFQEDPRQRKSRR
ncbi:hypothetical protein B0H14DRAFT_2846315 [Mycena olivaceomarginata]|nr:hypothetical protein B0H14DRAFT_2846315 [Mycena olivaceomarginata]